MYLGNYKIDVEKTGEKLKRILARRGIGVEELRKQMCFSDGSAIYRWLRGERLPSVENLYALHKLLDIHMEDLLADENVQVIPRNIETKVERWKNVRDWTIIDTNNMQFVCSLEKNSNVNTLRWIREYHCRLKKCVS